VWLVLVTYLCEALRISNSERPLVIGYDFVGYIDIGGETCGLFLCAEKGGRRERERRGSMRSSRTWTQQLQLCLFFFPFFRQSAGDSGVYQAPCNNSLIFSKDK